MGTAQRPYVNCHFCNARISVGYTRLDAMRQNGAILLTCAACDNADHYEASMVRDPLLMPATRLDIRSPLPHETFGAR